MPSLREVKDRIASVRSTLKITSAMKLVASSKLRKVQRAVESLRPFEEELSGILASLLPAANRASGGSATETINPAQRSPGQSLRRPDGGSKAPAVVLAFASNSSMCGAFNANVSRKALEVIRGTEGPVEVWAFGRKMSEALRKAGHPCSRDYQELVARPSFSGAAVIARELRELYERGDISRVLLVYNHFVSTGRQQIVEERYLPFEYESGDEARAIDPGLYILEPGPEELLATLLPQVLDLRLYAALLDSAAAEHAARMVAMQAATDNAEELLAELSLEYNKGRQYKITSEILDLVSGSASQ